MKNIKYLLFLFFSVFTIAQLKAQTVYAQVSSKQVQAGVPFEYAIVINANPNSYAPPSFKDFDVISGPNQSSSVQWVNGQTSVQMTISWSLIAKKEGKMVIEPSAVNIGSQKLETSSITIDVTKGPAGQPSGAASDQKTGSGISKGDLYIQTNISKSKCYTGEQITITQKVYCRYQIIGFQKFSQPTYDGFYSQAEESSSKGQLAVENIDGVNYYTYELFRTVAIANKSGKIQLTPVEGDVIIRRQSSSKARNIFEQFFGAPAYEDIPITAKSKAVIVDVLPLPEESKPRSFNGAVGDFSYKVQTTRTELKANDAFNLKITISGKGNLKLLNPSELQLPESFETYEPKLSESPGSKTFEYLVIPRNEGEYTLENLDFSYFNPEQKKYLTLNSGTIKINVLPADPNSAGTQVYSPQSQIRETENDIRYIKKGNLILTRNEREFFNSAAHVILIGLPLLGLGFALLGRKRKIELNKNLILVNERKAAKLARKRLASAEKLMQNNSKDAFYAEILDAINKYLSYKLNIPIAALSKGSIIKTLSDRKVNQEHITKVIDAISNSEVARYAPGAVSIDLKTTYNGMVELVAGLEQELNKRRTA
jgi:hypothetical protein